MHKYIILCNENIRFKREGTLFIQENITNDLHGRAVISLTLYRLCILKITVLHISDPVKKFIIQKDFYFNYLNNISQNKRLPYWFVLHRKIVYIKTNSRFF